MQLVRVGAIFDQSKVVRVDKGSGLLLQIPTTPVPTPAYVNVSSLMLLIMCFDILSINLNVNLGVRISGI